MWGSYEFGSVRLSIFNRIFLRIGSLVFYIFCVKSRNHKYWKLWQSIFLQKSLLARKKAQNDQISPFVRDCRVFLVVGSLGFYLIFCMMLRDHKYSKNWWSKIFCKNSCLCENRTKRCKMAWYLCSFIMAAFFSQDWLIRIKFKDKFKNVW